MPLILSDEARMVRETAFDFFRERSPITALRKLRDDNDPDGFSRGVVAANGGTWMDRLSGRGRRRRFGVRDDRPRPGDGGGRADPGRDAPDVHGAAWRLAAVAGRFGRRRKPIYLPPLLAGEHIIALALEEGARHAPDQIALQAEREGSGYRLNGQKTFVLDGHIADTLIVAARTAGEASLCFWCQETPPPATG